MSEVLVEQAAKAIVESDVLLFAAGAGIGVDSGLPDFRGNEGFWRAYPKFKTLGKSFSEMANPAWFANQPELAWGFYGHRYNLYQECVPHAGFNILKKWAESKEDHFIFTSNVDGQFQKSGFSEQHVIECHGSIRHFQCRKPCSANIWPAEGLHFEVDDIDMICHSPLPRCPHCGDIARPNILMFGDAYWLGDRSNVQNDRYYQFLNRNNDKKIVIIECGAGTAVPTVRYECESVKGQLIRINPRDSHGPIDTISLAMNAQKALEKIDSRIQELTCI